MPFNGAGLSLAAEITGFLSSLGLSWQTYRLILHQRAVKDLRDVAKEPASPKVAELAKKGATAFERTIARWDSKDQQFIIAGLIGLAVSFFLKIIALMFVKAKQQPRPLGMEVAVTRP